MKYDIRSGAFVCNEDRHKYEEGTIKNEGANIPSHTRRRHSSGLVRRADLPTAVKDDGGIPRACDIQNDGDRLSALIARLLPMKRSFSVYRSFTQNRAAFAVQPVGFGADPIADPEVKYQIMPVQKYDKSQTSYITPVGAGCNAFAISAKCTEPEAATLVLDALARESYRTLRRTVFEACYRHTYGAESDALNVFELMLDTAGCDPGIFLPTDIPTRRRRYVRREAGTFRLTTQRGTADTGTASPPLSKKPPGRTAKSIQQKTADADRIRQGLCIFLHSPVFSPYFDRFFYFSVIY